MMELVTQKDHGIIHSLINSPEYISTRA